MSQTLQRPATAVVAGMPPSSHPAAAPAPSRRVGRTPGLLRYASLLALVALWQLATVRGWTSTDTLPGPGKVAGAAGELWRSGELPDALRVSVLRVAAGAGIGIVVGLLAG